LETAPRIPQAAAERFGGVMHQFINDFIHLTRGEFMVKYWWLGVSLMVAYIAYLLIERYRDNKN
jgi:hypothetical protein